MKQDYCLIIGFLFYLNYFSLFVEEPEEKQRPRADFLQSRLNAMMQDTASWLDSTSHEDSKNASANGYLQLSWLPRTAELDDLDAKFKVFLHLPKLNGRLSLVIDNDDENERLLDYESDYTNVDQEGVNIAFQYIKQLHKEKQIKNRVGISRSQLYLRSEINFDGKLGET
jgi:hypothetical protein